MLKLNGLVNSFTKFTKKHQTVILSILAILFVAYVLKPSLFSAFEISRIESKSVFL